MATDLGARASILRAYWQARRRRRWSRSRIEEHQLAGMRALPGLGGAVTLDDALACLPLLTAGEFAAQFAERNALGLSLEEARHRAWYELDTGVSPEPGYSFGFSTGSTGEPGVFLTTPAERAQWVGSILGKLLPLRSLARPGGLDVALLLKHNNRLYSDVSAAGRVRLRYFDLAEPVARWAPRIAALAPQILVAPPSALVELAGTLAAGGPLLQPRMVLAGGEPLFPLDRATLGGVFGVVPRGLYQAKEGFLATGCARGRLHLNEDLLVFELQRFADRPERAVPVLTDFTRSSQTYWRYRMDDVLICDPSPCACGSRYTSVLAVEGRLSDVLLRGDGSPVFPFEVDAVLAKHLGAGRRSAVVQPAPGRFTLEIEGELPEALPIHLLSLLGGDAATAATLAVTRYVPPPPGEKLRRFRRLFDPGSEQLTRTLLPPLRPSP